MQIPKERGKRVRLLVIAAAVIGLLFLAESKLGQIDLEQLLADVSETLGQWTYLLVGLFAFLETGAFVGLLAPGETMVILAGAVAGQGVTDIFLTIAIVWFSAWAGDSASFLIGRRLGRGFIHRHGSKLRITEERFAQVEGYFQRHGGKTILIGRFIGLVRALAPFVAGSSGMRYAAFVPYSILGTGIWAATFGLIGYFASRSLNEAAEVAGRGTLLFGLTVATIVGIVFVVRHLRVASNRERLVQRMEGNRALRPLVVFGRRLQPPARFLYARLTPGGLGLELTTLLAVFAVSLYVLVVYAAIISGDPGPTPGDTAALEIARDLQAGWLTDVEEVVTFMGSAWATLAVALAAAVALGVARRWIELGVLVAALAITHLAVPELKDILGRARPADPLVGASGNAFPSGHAAYSVIYPWLALIVTARTRPGKAGGSLLIALGIALAAAIGLSRVYLRVHYLSDVSGGWALAVAAFSGCTIVALIATHLRHNDEP